MDFMWGKEREKREQTGKKKFDFHLSFHFHFMEIFRNVSLIHKKLVF